MFYYCFLSNICMFETLLLFVLTMNKRENKFLLYCMFQLYPRVQPAKAID